MPRQGYIIRDKAVAGGSVYFDVSTSFSAISSVPGGAFGASSGTVYKDSSDTELLDQVDFSNSRARVWDSEVRSRFRFWESVFLWRFRSLDCKRHRYICLLGGDWNC